MFGQLFSDVVVYVYIEHTWFTSCVYENFSVYVICVWLFCVLTFGNSDVMNVFIEQDMLYYRGWIHIIYEIMVCIVV